MVWYGRLEPRSEMRMQRNAISTLQEAAEAYLVELMEGVIRVYEYNYCEPVLCVLCNLDGPNQTLGNESSLWEKAV